MTAFHEPVLEDRLWVEERFRRSGYRGCEYSFATLFLWKDVYRQQVACQDGYVLERLAGQKGPAYLFPAGYGPLRPALQALVEDAEDRREPCRLVCVTPEQRVLLEEAWPGGAMDWEEDRDGFDYLYDINRLADLPGRKLQAKRNHINRFIDACPDWQVEEIGPDNLAACAAMDRAWNKRYRGRSDETAERDEALTDETHALALALTHYQELGLSGILLRAEGRVVAFTIGSPIGEDTFDIHFEKAYSEIQGAYPLINREFARWLRDRFPAVQWLNREDDLGLEGLRRSKESYYPDRMVEKYTATLPARRRNGRRQEGASGEFVERRRSWDIMAEKR